MASNESESKPLRGRRELDEADWLAMARSMLAPVPMWGMEAEGPEMKAEQEADGGATRGEREECLPLNRVNSIEVIYTPTSPLFAKSLPA